MRRVRAVVALAVLAALFVRHARRRAAAEARVWLQDAFAGCALVARRLVLADGADGRVHDASRVLADGAFLAHRRVLARARAVLASGVGLDVARAAHALLADAPRHLAVRGPGGLRAHGIMRARYACAPGSTRQRASARTATTMRAAKRQPRQTQDNGCEPAAATCCAPKKTERVDSGRRKEAGGGGEAGGGKRQAARTEARGTGSSSSRDAQEPKGLEGVGRERTPWCSQTRRQGTWRTSTSCSPAWSPCTACTLPCTRPPPAPTTTQQQQQHNNTTTQQHNNTTTQNTGVQKKNHSPGR